MKVLDMNLMGVGALNERAENKEIFFKILFLMEFIWKQTNCCESKDCFSINFGIKKANVHLDFSENTVINWFRIFWGNNIYWLYGSIESEIGGVGCTFEIDETHICKKIWNGKVFLSEAVWFMGEFEGKRVKFFKDDQS